MEISKILSSPEDLVKSKIGIGPYLNYSGSDVIISSSFEL